jgi:hypothetical protein
MSVEWFKKCSTLTLLTPDPGAARQNVEKHASTGCLHALRIPTDGSKTGIKEGRAGLHCLTTHGGPSCCSRVQGPDSSPTHCPRQGLSL